MTATLIRVYEALEVRERSLGGRGHMSDKGDGQTSSLGFFATESEAKVAAAGKGVWGGDGDVKSRDAVRLESGEVYILAAARPVKIYETGKEAIIERALAKLEPKEREALGYVRQ